MLDHVYAPHENMVAYEGNYFDSIFPLPCSFFNFLNLEGFLMRNTLSITKVPSGCKSLGGNKRICIFFLQTGLLNPAELVAMFHGQNTVDHVWNMVDTVF